MRTEPIPLQGDCEKHRTLGLKRPIAASKRDMANGYLACGETRMEALAALEIPAILVEASIEGRIRHSLKYKVIAASIDEVGIIEPPVVVPQAGPRGR